MFLMDAWLKISLNIVLIVVGIYILINIVGAIISFWFMLKREKNSYIANTDLLDYKIAFDDYKGSKWFPDYEAFRDLQHKAKDHLQNRDITYMEEKSDRFLKLAGWYIKSTHQANLDKPKIVIFCHGWKSSGICDCASNGYFYFDSSYDLVIVDHQGHGHSEGSYLGFGVLDKDNLYKWVKHIDDMYNGNCEIFLHGVSMGAYTLMLLNEYDLPSSVKGMVCDCGFISGTKEISYLAKANHLNFTFVKPLIWLMCKISYRYDLSKSSIDALKIAKVPILFIHGEKDNFVPVEHTKLNYEACASKKSLKVFKGCYHAASFINNQEEYEELVLNFFDEILGEDYE